MATPIWVPNNELVVPVALRYNDANGDPVTKLFPLNYLVLVGQDLGILSGTTNQLLAAWAFQAAEITTLQAAVETIPPEYNTPEISPLCLPLSGTTAIDIVLEALVVGWCNFLTVTGQASEIANSITRQCQDLNSSPSFGTPGTSMSAITGWVLTPETLADSFTNAWLTICDARDGIQNALDAITPTCAQVIVDYQVATTSSGTLFDFYFNSYTFIPTGFIDNGSQIKIVDSMGNQYLQSLNIVTQSTTSGPLVIPISGTTLQVDDSYTITVTSNVTNTILGVTCEKVVIKTIPPDTSSLRCCPTIGNYAGPLSGGTDLVIISGLAFAPRYVDVVAKNSATGAIFANLNYSYYLTYTSDGAILHTSLPVSSNTLNLDYIVYK